MKPKTVDDYISAAPKEHQPMLKKFRELIKIAAPKAEEKMSYGMPYYAYKGRLAYFRLAKNHVGLYIPPPVIQDHEKELKGYKTAKAAIQFPLNKKIPEGLIGKLVKARMKINEAKKKIRS